MWRDGQGARRCASRAAEGADQASKESKALVGFFSIWILASCFDSCRADFQHWTLCFRDDALELDSSAIAAVAAPTSRSMPAGDDDDDDDNDILLRGNQNRRRHIPASDEDEDEDEDVDAEEADAQDDDHEEKQ